MKKKFNIAIATLALPFFLVSCKKQLDVQPTTSIDAAYAFQTADDIESAAVGMYALLGNGACYGTNFNLISEILGHDGICNFVGTFPSYQEINNRQMRNNSADAARTWLQSYRAINLANNILANVYKITDANRKAELEGQAYFVRGILYFELIRLYALQYERGRDNTQLGVPIMLEAVSTAVQAYKYAKRNSVEEVYTQVLEDLMKAKDLLGKQSVNFRASKYTAEAFLSRVYLQKGDYINALSMANDVISNSGKTLNMSVTAVFYNKNTNESLFEIQQNDQNNAGTSNDGLTTFYAGQSNFVGRGDMRVDADYLATYESTDERKSELFYEGRRNRTYTAKWFTYGQNIPVIRLSEMYLTRAECNLRLGSSVGDTPINDVNTVRERAGVKGLTVPPNLMNILDERQFELCFEGLRIHDLRRTHRNTANYTYNSPKLVMPIPYREISANPDLEQNPTYE